MGKRHQKFKKKTIQEEIAGKEHISNKSKKSGKIIKYFELIYNENKIY